MSTCGEVFDFGDRLRGEIVRAAETSDQSAAAAQSQGRNENPIMIAWR